VGLADYHVHTNFSIDCQQTMEMQCRAALAAGVTEIAFTEHVDHDACDLESRDRYNYAAYVAELERCRALFDGQLTILKAAEIDWNYSIEEDVRRFIGEHEFEFIIGSMHNLNHTYVGFGTLEQFGGPHQMYDDYLDELEGLVSTGYPDVIGHLDLPRRYHHVSMFEVAPEHFEARLRKIFRIAAAQQVGFEINTSGLRRGFGVTYPEPDVLVWFVEEGGQIVTVGSDSHYPEHIGDSIANVYEALKARGIDWRTSFVGGSAERVPLP
jgi:histidinol-phosphatase (PHP family)